MDIQRFQLGIVILTASPAFFRPQFELGLGLAMFGISIVPLLTLDCETDFDADSDSDFLLARLSLCIYLLPVTVMCVKHSCRLCTERNKFGRKLYINFKKILLYLFLFLLINKLIYLLTKLFIYAFFIYLVRHLYMKILFSNSF